jgi:hypothetical protein
MATTTPEARPVATRGDLAAGAGVGTPIAIVALYVLERLGENPPEAVDVAITAIIVAVVTRLAGRFRTSTPA